MRYFLPLLFILMNMTSLEGLNAAMSEVDFMEAINRQTPIPLSSNKIKLDSIEHMDGEEKFQVISFTVDPYGPVLLSQLSEESSIPNYWFKYENREYLMVLFKVVIKYNGPEDSESIVAISGFSRYLLNGGYIPSQVVVTNISKDSDSSEGEFFRKESEFIRSDVIPVLEDVLGSEWALGEILDKR